MATLVLTTIVLSLAFLSLLSPSKADALGFSLDLTHRDSPASPFYDHSLTHFHRIRNALRRSHDRANHIISASKNVHSTSSQLNPSGGAFVMKIALGTPPVTVMAIADTGSDITWTQCKPCTKCYNQTAPLFDPRKSSTYKIYAYNSSKCQNLDEKLKSPNGTCEYEVSYGDSSYTHGDYASETLTLGVHTSRPVYFPRFSFGCGFENSGTFNEDEAGLVGLGGGPNSLISHIKPSIKGKFSYCFTPGFTKTKIASRINFGNNALVSGIGVVTTPIIPSLITTFYTLKLESLSVGKDSSIRLFPSSLTSTIPAGNIIIDSGTTLTYLPNSTYSEFVKAVFEAMGNKTVDDPSGLLELCYRISDKPSYPKITAHFTGASIELRPINTFVQLNDNVTCLAFAPSTVTAIWGNIAQTNFLVGYDTIGKTVSFKSTTCGPASRQ